MDEFILLLHESPTGFADVSPEEMQRVIEEYGAWRTQLEEAGRLSGANKLADEGGRSLRGNGAQLQVTDGPYAEAKEVIGGYFVIRAAGYDEAVELSRGCPHLKYDGRIELRPS